MFHCACNSQTEEILLFMIPRKVDPISSHEQNERFISHITSTSLIKVKFSNLCNGLEDFLQDAFCEWKDKSLATNVQGDIPPTDAGRNTLQRLTLHCPSLALQGQNWHHCIIVQVVRYMDPFERIISIVKKVQELTACSWQH